VDYPINRAPCRIHASPRANQDTETNHYDLHRLYDVAFREQPTYAEPCGRPGSIPNAQPLLRSAKGFAISLRFFVTRKRKDTNHRGLSGWKGGPTRGSWCCSHHGYAQTNPAIFCGSDSDEFCSRAERSRPPLRWVPGERDRGPGHSSESLPCQSCIKPAETKCRHTRLAAAANRRNRHARSSARLSRCGDPAGDPLAWPHRFRSLGCRLPARGHYASATDKLVPHPACMQKSPQSGTSVSAAMLALDLSSRTQRSSRISGS